MQKEKVILTLMQYFLLFAYFKEQLKSLVWLFGFYGISTFAGYLMPNPFLYKQFYFK